MQNTWRRGLALGNAPDARIMRWRYQHVGIFWRYLTLKFAFSPTPTPDASQWNISCVGSQCKILALAMHISCFLCRFHLRLVPNANPISSGIWALSFTHRILNDSVDAIIFMEFHITKFWTKKASFFLHISSDIGFRAFAFPLGHKSPCRVNFHIKKTRERNTLNILPWMIIFKI